MSKQITANELAEIITKLLTTTSGELEEHETFSSFMTDIAKVICDHCGGEVKNPATQVAGTWFVEIQGNDSLPDENGGIWQDFDPQGVLLTTCEQHDSEA